MFIPGVFGAVPPKTYNPQIVCSKLYIFGMHANKSYPERLATTLLTLTTGTTLTLTLILAVACLCVWVWYRVSGWHHRRSIDSLMMMMVSGVMVFVGRQACIDCFIIQHLSLRSHVRHCSVCYLSHTHTHTHTPV